jgi:hypothetical protein
MSLIKSSNIESDFVVIEEEKISSQQISDLTWKFQNDNQVSFIADLINIHLIICTKSSYSEERKQILTFLEKTHSEILSILGPSRPAFASLQKEEELLEALKIALFLFKSREGNDDAVKHLKSDKLDLQKRLCKAFDIDYDLGLAIWFTPEIKNYNKKHETDPFSENYVIPIEY